MSNSFHYHENVLGANTSNSDSLAAPGLAGTEDTSQLALKSSKCADVSFCSTHLNPGGAAACVGCEDGNLNLASDIPSLTPALITAYSSQQDMTTPINPAITENRKKLPKAAIESSLLLGTDGSSSTAAGLAGTEVTKKSLEFGCSELKDFFVIGFSSPMLRALIPINLVILFLASFQQVAVFWAKDTPFSVIEDWADFFAFVFLYSLQNLIDGLRNFFVVGV